MKWKGFFRSLNSVLSPSQLRGQFQLNFSVLDVLRVLSPHFPPFLAVKTFPRREKAMDSPVDDTKEPHFCGEKRKLNFILHSPSLTIFCRCKGVPSIWVVFLLCLNCSPLSFFHFNPCSLHSIITLPLRPISTLLFSIAYYLFCFVIFPSIPSLHWSSSRFQLSLFPWVLSLSLSFIRTSSSYPSVPSLFSLLSSSHFPSSFQPNSLFPSRKKREGLK